MCILVYIDPVDANLILLVVTVFVLTCRSGLLESIANDKGMLKNLEDKTLDLLQKSEGELF